MRTILSLVLLRTKDSFVLQIVSRVWLSKDTLRPLCIIWAKRSKIVCNPLGSYNWPSRIAKVPAGLCTKVKSIPSHSKYKWIISVGKAPSLTHRPRADRKKNSILFMACCLVASESKWCVVICWGCVDCTQKTHFFARNFGTCWGPCMRAGVCWKEIL